MNSSSSISRLAWIVRLTAAVGLAVQAASPAATSTEPSAPPVLRVYSHPLEPREHPDDDRRAVRPPDWGTFGGLTRFTTLRGFDVQGDRIVGFAEELEKFTRTHELGEVVWPSYPVLFAKNLGDLADEIRRRDLFLFDVWGYVPGSGPGGYWQQFRPPAAAFELLESRLGDRWLGTDIGEQDGRYIGGYANQMTPASADRREQYLQFQRHFERMGDDLGHRHATLVSLNFGHYLIKEGTYTLIGAETAQALPNNQVYYAFIRGAGKQYGVPWFGNASIFNRWGYKVYGSSGRGDGYDFGPTKGTSLSLLERLLYTHILYNSVAVGFENGWFEGDRLSPIGRIQQAARRWVREHGPVGVQHTPVALLLDFHCGWSFPRHLYTDRLFRVWGNLPYGPGDHLTDAILDLLYPRYADASYFHDETGFLVPTPYGDIADCLLSDAPLWLLRRYPLLVVAGELSGGREIRDRLLAYIREGGHLILTAGNLARLPGGLGGHTAVTTNLQVALGRGRLELIASPFGVEPDPAFTVARSANDQPLARPFRLEAGLRETLRRAFDDRQLFAVDGEGLSFVTCRRSAGEYLLGIANNTWRPQRFTIRSRCGEIVSLVELALDPSKSGATGQVPEGIDASLVGRNEPQVIAGGDLRILAVRVRESGVSEIAHVRPPPRPRGRWLPLRRFESIRDEILSRPTFFQHWDGVIVDGGVFRRRDIAALRAESGWLRRQKLRVAVDLSSAINLYPGLRLIPNLEDDYAASRAAVREVLEKMAAIGARDLLVSLHRHPENNYGDDQTRAGFESTLKDLCREASERGITVHLRTAFGKPPWDLADGLRWLDRVGADNLKLAPSTALLTDRAPDEGLAERLRGRVGLWLVAGSRRDVAGQVWDTHVPADAAGQDAALVRWLALVPEAVLGSDALLPDADAEYGEASALARLRP